jgi:predicted N-acetyltransferase YhbS
MISIRVMTPADVPLGMRLKAQAGWNQTEADWARFLSMAPAGCFVAERGGGPVGTVVTCDFAGVAWVAMMLVDEGSRRQGVGAALLRHALAYLDEKGVATVRLDATPMGQPMYERFGFAAQVDLTRYVGRPTPTQPASASATEPFELSQLDAIAALDGWATHTDRRAFLSRLLPACASATRVVTHNGAVIGYATARPGSNATQVGPCIARHADAGRALLADALGRCAGRPVILDVPTDHRAAAALAESAGLKPQRTLTRMARGRAVTERPDALWAGSGPELG